MDRILRRIILDQMTTYCEIATSIETHWESQIHPIRARLEQAVAEGDEEGTEWHSEQWAAFDAFQVGPQREALFLGLWAFFEGNLIALTKEVRKSVGKSGDWKPSKDIVFSSIKALKSDGNIDVLSPTQLADLKVLRNLRNCITHNQGQVKGDWFNAEFKATGDHELIQTFMRRHGLGNISNPKIELHSSFLPFAANALSALLKDLYDRDEELRPNGSDWDWQYP